MTTGQKLFSDTGEHLLNARKAAKVLDCAPDYVSRLCREGKLIGVRHQGQWYVAPSSLSLFAEGRDTAKAERAQVLASERREETLAYTYANKSAAGKVAHRLTSRFSGLSFGKQAMAALVASVMLGSVAFAAGSYGQNDMLPAALARVESPFFAPSFFSLGELFGDIASLFAPKTEAVATTPAEPAQPQKQLPVAAATSSAPASHQNVTNTYVTNTYPVIERTIVQAAPGQSIDTSDFVTHEFLSEQLDSIVSHVHGGSSSAPFDPSSLTASDIPDLSSLYLSLNGGTVVGTTTLAGITLSALDCSALGNGGKLTTDALGNIVCQNDNGSGGIAWGSITGTLSAQTDLQTALNAKLDASAFGARFFTFFSATTTDALTQGSTNKYYNDTLVQTYLATLDKGFFFSTTSANYLLSTKNYATQSQLFAYPFPSNATSTQIAFNGGLTASNASTTALTVSGISNALLSTNNGSVGATTVSGPLNFSGTTLSLAQATRVASGYLSGADFTTFDNKISSTSLSGGTGISYNSATGVITNTGATFGYPFVGNATTTQIAFNGGLTASQATITYASSTALTAANLYSTNASTTNLVVSGLGGAAGQCLTIDAFGVVTTTTCGSGSGTSFAYPFPSNATSTSIAFNGGLSSASTTLTGNTVVQYASSTALTATNLYSTNASTTALTISGTANGLLKTVNGVVTAAVAGTDYLTSANIFAYPFPSNATSTQIAFNGGLTAPNAAIAFASTTVLSANTICISTDCRTAWPTAGSSFAYPFPLAGNATSTLTQFNGGLTAYASSTIGNGTLGLTINGPATTTGALAVQGTGTSTFGGAVSIAGNLLPSAGNTYTLGSAANPWESAYIGPNSLYVNGQKVLSTDGSQNVVVSSDINQNLQLKTTGIANILLTPQGSGQIQLGGPVQVSGGKNVTTSDSSALLVPFGVAAGNITVSGNTIFATNTNGGISITPAGNGGTYVTAGNVGIGTTNPLAKLQVNGDALFYGQVSGQYFTATSTAQASTLPYASSTALTVAGALYTPVISSLIKTDAAGKLVAATPGADYQAAGNYATFSYPFPSNATSTSIAFNGGLTASQATITYASSTALTATNLYSTNASTTNLNLSGVSNSLLSTNNGVVGATTVSAPLSFSGTTLSISQSGTGSNGYLSSTDFNTFNNKISSTSLSGASVISYNSSTGVITTTGGTFGAGAYVFPGNVTAPYASTTNITSALASTTALNISGISGALLKTVNGVVTAAVAGSDYLTGASIFAYPFPSNATSTSIAFNGGLTASTISAATSASLASTTLTGNTLLTNASTTNLYISSTIAGAGLQSCNPSSGKLLYNAATGQFFCGSDAGAGGGITALGPLGQQQTGSSQTLATSTLGSDFTITATGDTITFNIPDASAAARGLLTSADWTTFNNKISSTSLSGGAGISYNPATGVIANTGVTSLTAGTNITLSGATGAVTITGLAYAFPNNATSTSIAFNGGLTASSATITYASSTALTVSGTGYFGTASTTALNISGIPSGLLKTVNGAVTAAVAGTDYVVNSQLFAYSFPSNATSTSIAFNNGLTGKTLAIGATATTTIDSAGNLLVQGGTAAGTSLDVNGTANALYYNVAGSQFIDNNKKLSVNFASSTGLSTGYASTTNLVVSGIPSGLLKTVNGVVTAAVSGTDYIVPSQLFAYLFPSNATSTSIAFNGGLTASTISATAASSTNLFGGTLTANTASFGATATTTISSTGVITAQNIINSGVSANQILYTNNSKQEVSAATGTVSNGTGISVTGNQYIIGSGLTITNTGVTSLVAGTNITLSGSTGAVTVNGLAYPFPNNATSTSIAFNGGLTASQATITYASSTALTATTLYSTNASTTNLNLSGISNALLKTVNGVVSAAVAGTDYLTAATTFAYPFPNNATSTLIAFNGGLTASNATITYASSTALTATNLYSTNASTTNLNLSGVSNSLLSTNNGVVGATTVNAPLSFSGTTLSISQSGTGSNGYLSSTDFNTFNNKISSTSLSGASVISYNSSTGVITTTGGTFGAGAYVFPGNVTAPYASSTALTVSGSLYTPVVSSLLKTDAAGKLVAAVLGTDYQNFAYPFPSNATSTLIAFNGGLTAGNATITYASSTALTASALYSTNASTSNLTLSLAPNGLLVTNGAGTVSASTSLGINVGGTGSSTAAGAFINLTGGSPYFNVEAYRLPGDTPGDDTAAVQRACDAAAPYLGSVHFDNKTYTVSQITVGTEGLRVKCDLVGAAWNGDVGLGFTGGTKIKQISGSNVSMIVVPSTAPPVSMENLYLDGNKAGQSCSAGTAVIDFVDYTTDSTKARSGLLHNIRIDSPCYDGIYAGLLRNAGVLDHVVVLAAAHNNLSWASNNDWRFYSVDSGGAVAEAFDCAGCGSLQSYSSDYFTSLNGVKIESTALDVEFFGGSIDTNTHDGAVVVGNPSSVQSFTRAFNGVRFNQNGLAANNTYADIKAVGDANVSVTNSYFTKGTASGTGGNYEKYLISVDATSKVVWANNQYATDGTTVPYQTAVTNDWSKMWTGLANGSFVGSFGVGTSSPFGKLGISLNTGDGAYSGNNAFIIASSTSGATTTLFAISNTGTITTSLGSGLVKSTGGVLSLATAGTDYVTANQIFSYPFGLTGNATSTLTQFNGGLTAYASTTIGNGTQAGGLTISGGATTTGNAFILGNLGIGTQPTSRALEISGTAKVSSTLTLGSITSCLGSQALQTDASGNISCGNISATSGASAAGGWQTDNNGIITLSTTTDRVAIGATTTPYAKLSVLSGNAGTTTLALVPASSQTANILDIYDISGNLASVLTAGNSLGLGTTSPVSKLSVNGSAYISGGATSTSLGISGLTGALLKTNAQGSVVAAVPGVDYQAAGNYATFAYPFPSNATSTSIAFNGGLTAVGATTTALAVTGSTTISSVLNIGGAINAASTVTATSIVQGSIVRFSQGNTAATPGFSSAGDTDTGLFLSQSNGNFIGFSTGGTEVGRFTTTGLGIGSSTPGTALGVNGDSVLAGIVTGQYFIATSTLSASRFAYASTTNITSALASTTALNISGVSSALLKTVNGAVTAAVAGTDYLTAATTFVYPFALAGNATSTLTQFNGGLTAYASTTIGNGSQLGGLTVSGGATTTGNAYIAGTVGVGTQPTANSISAANNISTLGVFLASGGCATFSANQATAACSIGGNIFQIGAQVSGAGVALYANNAEQVRISGTNGYVGVGTTTPGTRLAVNGDSVLAGIVTGQYFIATSTLSASRFAYASTTAISGTIAQFATASSTSLNISGVSNSLLSTNNGVVGATTVSAPLSFSGTTLSISQSGTGSNGYLSSTDFTTFNNKISSTSLSGASVISYNSSTGVITTVGGTFGAGNYVFPANVTAPYASSTALTVSGALYTPVISSLLKTDSAGKLVAAVLGTDYQNFAYPFPSNATSTSIAFNGGLTATTIVATSATSTGLFGGVLSANTASFGGTATTTIDSAGKLTAQNIVNSGVSANQLIYTNNAKQEVSVATGTISNGTGISVTAGQYVIGSGLTITNTGVTSLVAGTNITLSGSTGAITVTGLAYPFPSNATSTSIAFNGGLTGTTLGLSGIITSTATAANVLPYASSTALTATNLYSTTASTTNLNISGISASLLKTVNGVVTAAVAGTDYLTAATTFAYPFPNNATSTSIAFNGGLTASTISATSATSTNLFGGTLTANTASFGATATSTFDSAGKLTTQNIVNSGVSANQIIYTNNGKQEVSVATSTATLASEFTYGGGTLGSLVGGSSGTLSLTNNGVALTKLNTIGANTILGNPTGATGNVQAFSTSSLGIALADTSGTLSVARGGTGSTTLGGILAGGGSSSIYSVATSSATCSSGVSCTGFTVLGNSAPVITNTGVTSLVAGTNITLSGSTGAVTVNGLAYPFPSNATSTTIAFNNGLTAYASTTIGNGTALGGLTVSGNSTTTGNAVVQGTQTAATFAVDGTNPVLLSSAGNPVAYADLPNDNSAFGINNTVGATFASAVGMQNTAVGYLSGAFGAQNTASNNTSMAFGWANNVSGVQAAAFGLGIVNDIDNSVMVGPANAAKLTILSTGETLAPYFTATSTNASTFAYASTTNITSTLASTTALNISGISGALLKTVNGVVTAAVAGTDYQNFAYPFPSNATSTSIAFNGGLTASQATITYASSTALTATNLYSTNASTTNLNLSGVSNSLLSTNNGVVGATTVSAPLSFSGTTLSISQSGTGSNGYLSSTDFNTFNNKISSTSLSGASVISYNSSTGVITTTPGTFVAGDYTFTNKVTIPYASSTAVTVSGNAYLNTASLTGAITSTATGPNTLPYASTTALTVSGRAYLPATNVIGANNFIRSGAHDLTLTTTGTTVATIPTGTVTLADLGSTQTFSGAKTFSSATTAFSANSAILSLSSATGVKTISTGGTTDLNLAPGGNVGIASTTPGTKLGVNGAAVIAGQVTGQYFSATSTLAASTFPYASTTALSATGLFTSTLTATSIVQGSIVRFSQGNTAATPGFSSAGDTDTGLFLSQSNGNFIGFSTGGTEVGRFTTTGLGIGSSTPGTALGVNGDSVLAGIVTGQYFIATSTLTASIFNYASTTAISGTIAQFTTASSTNLTISGIPSALLKTVNGVVTAAVAGTDYLTNASIFAYPFPSNATSTSIAFNGGLTSASTTLTGSTVLQNATTSYLGLSTISSKLLKTSAQGSVVAAVAGTDYENPLTFSTGLSRIGDSVTNAGVTSATGTLNQVNVNQNTGDIILSLPTLVTLTKLTVASATSTNSFTSGVLSANAAAFGGTATTTIDAAGNLAVGGTLTGAGLGACSGSTDKLLYSAGTFSCGTDLNTGSGSDANWTYFNGSAIRPGTTTNAVLIGATATTSLAQLEVHGGLSADYASTTGISAAYASTTDLHAQQVTVAGGTILQVAGNPTLAATVTTSNNTGAAAVSGRFAYAADLTGGLRIVDISNPASPDVVSSYAYNGGSTAAVSVAVAGRYAYVGDTSAGVVIIDISDAANPVKVGTAAAAGGPQTIALSGKYVYAADRTGETLKVIDVSNPLAPSLAGTFVPGGGADVYGLAVSGKYAYVGDVANGKIYIVDISNPTAPAKAGVYSAPGAAPVSLYASGRYVYAGDANSGFYAVDVSDPASPSLAGSYAGSFWGVSVAGQYAYVADNGGTALVLDLADISAPSLAGTLATGGNPLGIVVSGKYAYVSADNGGLKVLDINGARLPAADIGSLAAGTANIQDSLAVGGDLYAGGGLDVGISGIYSRGTIAAYIASSTQANATVASFIGGNVGIGTTSPFARLSVVGDAYVAGNITGGNITATGTLAVTGQTTLTTASSTAFTATSLYATNLTVGTLSGILKATSGVVSAATLGSDYINNSSIDTSAELATIVTDETGSGSLVFGTNATLSSTTLTGNTFAQNATTSFLGLPNIVSKLLKTDANGTVVAAVAGTDYLTAATTFAYPFALAGNATSTLTQFNGGLTAYASTTIGNGSQLGGLTVSGGATTTGNAYIAGTVGVGTQPTANSISAANNISTLGVFLASGGCATFSANQATAACSIGGNIFQIGAQVSGAGVALYANNAEQVRISGTNGYVGVGTTTPGTRLAVNGDSVLAGIVTGQIFYATSTLTASRFTYASSTALTVSGALYTPVTSSLLKTDSAGKVTAAVLGTDYTNFAWPFTPTTNFGAAANSTSTAIWFQAGLQASSTANLVDTNIFGKLGFVASSTVANDTLATVNGQKFLQATTSSGGGILTLGYQAGNALLASSTGGGSTAVGFQALLTATSSQYNTAVGYKALTGVKDYSNGGATQGVANTGSYNTALGWSTFSNVTSGYENVGLGAGAGAGVTSGHGNVALGAWTLNAANTASGNLAIGSYSLNNTTGGDNVAVGTSALTQNRTGTSNVAVGSAALFGNVSATSSVAIGFEAGAGNYTAYSNQGSVFIGTDAGYNVQTGSDYNTAVGINAGRALTTGTNNLILGADPSQTNTLSTGSNNIILGTGVSATTSSAFNSLNIGNILYGTGVASGANASVSAKIGIGTTTPYRTLSVSGSGVFSGGDVLASTLTATSTITASSIIQGSIFRVSSGNTAATPAYSATGDADSGIFLSSANGNFVGIATAGTETARFTATGLGIGSSTPGTALAVSGAGVVAGQLTAQYFSATSTANASTFAYASSTALTATSAFTTNLTVGSLSGILKAVSGVVSAATLGTDYINNGSIDTSAELAAIVTDETGSGSLVFGTNATLSSTTVNGNLAAGNIVNNGLSANQLIYTNNAKQEVSVATGTISNGTGISVTAGQYVIGSGLTITNTGVTSLVAGTNITLSGSTGAITVTGLAYPFPSNATSTSIAFNGGLTGTTLGLSGIITSTATVANVLPYASSTALTVSGALYTPVISSLLKTDSVGKVVAAVLGTDYTNFAYPFALTGNATSTLTQFNGGLTAYASTTIGNGTQTGGLTVSGNATTTGTTTLATLGGNVGIGTASPAAKLDVNGSIKLPDDTTVGKLMIGNFGSYLSRTGSDGSTILQTGQAHLLLNPAGSNVGVGTSSPSSLFSVGGRGYFAGGLGVGAVAPADQLFIKQSSDNFGQSGYGLNINRAADDTRLVIGYRSAGTAADTFQIAASFLTNGSFRPITFLTSDAERLRIDTGGNIGIGTSTPQSLLSVNGLTTINGVAGGGTTGLQIKAGGNTSADATSLDFSNQAGSLTNLRIFSDAANGQTRIKSQGNLSLHAGDTGFTATNEFMTILTTGNVGIGTTTPYSSANLGGSANKTLDITGTNAQLALHNSSDARKEFTILNHTSGVYFDATGAATAANNQIVFRTNNTNSSNNSGLITAMTITSAGNLVYGGGSFTYNTNATSTIPNNTKFAFTFATSSTASPLLRIDTTTGSEQVVLGSANADILIGDTGSSPNLVFQNNVVIKGLTGQLLTFGAGSDKINFAVNVGIGTANPTHKLDVALGSNEIAALNDGANASGFWGTNIGFLSQSSTAQITTNGSVPLAFYTGGTLNSMTAGSERMRIDTSGRVGIGTASPLAPLQVTASVANTQKTVLYLQNSAGVSVANTQSARLSFLPDSHFIGAESLAPYIEAMTDNTSTSESSLRFGTYNGASVLAEKMIIKGGGNVGINTSDPGTLLTVKGSSQTGLGSLPLQLQSSADDSGLFAGIRGAGASFGANTAVIAASYTSTGSYKPLVFATNDAERMRIDTTGAILFNSSLTASATGNYLCINTSTFEVTRGNGSTCSTSDQRLKKNITSFAAQDGLAAIEQLRPVTFNWRSPNDAPTTQYGFIAQEVASVLPDFVTDNGTQTVTNTDGSTTMLSHVLSLNYNAFIPVAIKGIQELDARTDFFAATTSVADLLAATTTPRTEFASTTPWYSAFAGAGKAVKDALGGLGNAVVAASQRAIYASAGIFDQVISQTITADVVNAKELCLADDSGQKTCVTKAQLDSLLTGQSQGGSGSQNGNGDTGGSGGQGGGDTGTTTGQGGDTGTSTPDTEAPVVTLTGDANATVVVNAAYSDVGATVTDNVDQGLAYTIAVNGGAALAPGALSLDTSAPTTYTLDFAATDTAGNVGHATRMVVVQ